MNLDKANLIENTLIITNDDGSITCIPEENCTETEQAMFTTFREAYPNGKTVAVDIESLKTSKADEISQACALVIVSGFNSTAFQSIDKLYSSTLEDQANITGNALSAMSKLAGTPGCENDKFYYHATGEEFVEWTATECLTLARDLKAFKETALFKSKLLQAYIAKLTVADTISAVTWNTEVPS